MTSSDSRLRGLYPYRAGTVIVALDFDGVLCGPPNGARMGDPIEGAREAVARLTADGHQLYVLTARSDLMVVTGWLRTHGFMVPDVVNRKPRADCYVDDLALRFESWPSTYYAIRDQHG